MNKDKLMQAAGRMRQLDKQQKIIIVGPGDVTNSILKLCNLTHTSQVASKHVLEWIMHNTIETIQTGMFQWATQGSIYAMLQKTKNIQHYQVKEIFHLFDFYAHSVVNKVMKDSFFEKNNELKRHFHGSNDDDEEVVSDVLFKRICQRVDEYGNDFNITTSALDEECEKELEKELEIEKEKENEVPKASPQVETCWNYELLFQYNNIQNNITEQLFFKSSKALSLTDYIDNKISKRIATLACIDWEIGNIFLTKNFAITVDVNQGNFKFFDDYLRTVDVIIKFPDGYNLLVSEFEADAILPIFWNKTKTKTSLNGLQFVNLAYLKRSQENEIWRSVFNFNNIIVKDLVLLQLFNGDTSFSTEEQKSQI
jgi:hypothetical protein